MLFQFVSPPANQDLLLKRNNNNFKLQRKSSPQSRFKCTHIKKTTRLLFSFDTSSTETLDSDPQPCNPSILEFDFDIPNVLRKGDGRVLPNIINRSPFVTCVSCFCYLNVT